MKKVVLISALFIFLFSCKHDRKDLIVGTWRAARADNHSMDSVFSEGQKFIDTLGNSRNDAVNIELYGTTNIDSIKKEMQAELDSTKKLQQATVQSTEFTFRKDGVAILNFSGSMDSTRWYFDDEGALVLDELKEKGAGDKLKMEVVALADTVLKLRFTEQGDMSVVTFYPVKTKG